MYGAYLDESFDAANSGIYAVAAVFGDGWHVMEGEKLWKKLLAKHDLRIFKSKSMAKRPKVVAEFTEAICNSGLLAWGLVTKQSEALAAIRGSALHKRYQSEPYMLMYQQTFVNIAMDMREAGIRDSVSFVCDEHARYSALMKSGFEDLRARNQQSAPFMGSCSMESDEKCVPLQMADLIAGALRVNGPMLVDGGTKLTPTIDMLIDRKVLQSFRYMNQRSLELARASVDKRAAEHSLVSDDGLHQ